MKKLTTLLIAIVSFVVLATCVSANNYVFDYANLLTQNEVDALEDHSEMVYDSTGVSVIIWTENNINVTEETEDDYFFSIIDTDKYNHNAAIFALDLAEGYWYAYTIGEVAEAVTSADIDSEIPESAVLQSIIDGNNYAGFEAFIDYVVDELIELYDSGTERTAITNYQYVFDYADLLTEYEEQSLEAYAKEVYDTMGISVVIQTENSLNSGIYTYAESIINTDKYNHNGAIMLIDMGDRAWEVVVTGETGDSVTDNDIDRIRNGSIITKLSNGDYYSAFDSFITFVKHDVDVFRNPPTFIERIINVLTQPKSLLICLVIGIIVAVVTDRIFMGQIKNVYKKSDAKDYVEKDSIEITRSFDRFLYSRTTKVKKAETKSSSSHSSGGSHGGGGHF